MLASAAEPILFEPVVEPSTDNKTFVRVPLQNDVRRVYMGGFFVSPLGRDLKKIDPDAFVLGTGVEPFSRRLDSIFMSWFGFSPNTSLQIQKEFLDAEVETDWEWTGPKLETTGLIQMGHDRTRELLRPFINECKLP